MFSAQNNTIGDFKQSYFLLQFQIPLKCQSMYCCIHFVSVFLLCVGFTMLWPFFSRSTPCSDGARFQPGIWWKKGSFLLFWISCFCRLPGEGVGWLHHSPPSRTGLTTLMWPRSASLLSLAMGLFLHCAEWHLMSPSIRNLFSLCTGASFLGTEPGE